MNHTFGAHAFVPMCACAHTRVCYVCDVGMEVEETWGDGPQKQNGRCW